MCGLSDLPANVPAELIASQRRNGWAAEEISRVEHRVAQKLEDIPVILVSSRI